MDFLIINYPTLLVNRYTGSWSNGYWTPSLDSSFNIAAQVQTIMGEELQRLEEGDRVRDPKTIFTKTLLLKDDQVTISGSIYKIKNVKVRGDQTFLKHYECLALKEKEKEN